MSDICTKFYEEALWRSDYAALLGRGATSLENISQEMSGKARPNDLVSKGIAGILTGVASGLSRQSGRFSASAYDYAQNARQCYNKEGYHGYIDGKVYSSPGMFYEGDE